jgi:hypothetical protein
MSIARAYTIALLAALCLLSGCAHTMSQKEVPLEAASSPFEIFNGEYINTISIKERPPASIAVLPFGGDSSDWELELADEDPPSIVRTGFYNQMASLPYRDQELHVTDARLERAGFYTAEEVRQALENDPQALGQALGVDAAVTGTVTHFDRLYAGLGSQVAVGCDVRMIDLRTGNLLWQAKHVSRGFAGGVSINPLGLAMNAIASLWNLRQVQLYRETDNLFREMVSTIYVPTALKENQPLPPSIGLFAAVDGHKTFKAGDTVRFRLVGDPGNKALVSVQGLEQSVALEPATAATAKALREDIMSKAKAERVENGLPFPPESEEELSAELSSMQVYEGSLTAPEGFEQQNAIATATLVSESGGLARRVHPGGLDFDAKAPEAPANLAAHPLDAKVNLAWDPVRDTDLEAYEIWASSQATDGFKQIADSGAAKAVVGELVNFEPVYFKVRAVDNAGNAGDFSQAIETLPSPEPGLADLPLPGPSLSGEVAERVYLPAEAGPYRVEGDVRIVPGARLIIGPGAELGFASGASLTVAGGEIAAYGKKDRPIQIRPLQAGAKPGTYGGLVLEGAKSALLRHVTVSGARIGITIRSCSPDMAGVVVTQSAQAGMHLSDNAAPSMTDSAIVGNLGMGGLVMEGKGLAPCIQSTIFSDNNAFDVQSYSRVTIDLSGNYWTRTGAKRTLGKLRLEPALNTRPEAAP